MPNFVPPDTCMEDYVDRRSVALRKIRDETPGDMKTRYERSKEWLDANSPYTPQEKLQNLLRAIFEDDEHAAG